MGEDPGDPGGLGDHGDDPHQPLAPGTGERIDLEEAAEQLRPAESGCAERPVHRLDDRDRRCCPPVAVRPLDSHLTLACHAEGRFPVFWLSVLS
jgi:hypothetical protein